MNMTICTSDFSFDNEIFRKLNEYLDDSLRKHSQSYIMRIDIDLPKDLDKRKKSTFLQVYTEKIKDKNYITSKIQNN